jgi:hypothetical protein
MSVACNNGDNGAHNGCGCTLGGAAEEECSLTIEWRGTRTYSDSGKGKVQGEGMYSIYILQKLSKSCCARHG